MIMCSNRVSGRGVSLKAKRCLQIHLKGISPAAASAPESFLPKRFGASQPAASAWGCRDNAFPRPSDNIALVSHQRTNRVSGSPLPKGILPSALCSATH